MTTPHFIHLACHTEYSLVDGLLRIEELIDSAKKSKTPACAITDQSNLFALVKFYMKAQKSGIKPIIGSDLWLDADAPSQFILLCQNLQGYRNLTQLISKSYLEGQHNNIPYIKREWLVGKTEGLIAILGQNSDVGSALVAENQELAKKHLEFWQPLFPQRLYFGLQRIGKPDEENYIYEAVTLAAEQNLPVVATNAVCFLHEDDFEAHEVRVCIRESFTLADPRRPKKYTPQQYLRSPAEMVELFADIPEAIENTWYIAQRCNLQLTLGKNFLPDFPVPAGKTTDEYFCEQARLGLDERLAQQNITSESQQQLYKDRLEQELKVILQMGFPGYFLIVADFIQWAKNHHIPVGPGRGSGAGSLVAYTLKITDLDPLPYDLLFERFLNPERVSMPDFDVDFCMIGRDDVIDYVAERYGRDRVSQIITYGTMAAKAVVRDVGRVLGHPYGFVDQIAKLIPFELGITLDKALDDTPELQQRYETDEDVTTLIDMARKLEGLTRNVGTHAGGVVIAPSQLTDFSPLYCEEGSQDIVTQFDKDDIEKVGLVKFDFLGLRTLTIIKWALENINRYRDEPLDINKIPLDDKKAFELLKRADTTAVFQLESDGLKELIKRLKPDCFEDIVALVALYRPGPLQSGMVDDFIDRKHGRAKIEYPHPELAPVLKPTYGVIVYQEQVMQIAQVLAGYTLGGADILRRCLSGSTQVIDSQTGNLVTLREIAADRDKWLGRPVFSLDLTTQQIVTCPISEVYPNGVREVWEVTTRTHRKIRATADHLFYTLLGWKPLQEFKAGDRIGLAKNLPISCSEVFWDEIISIEPVGEEEVFDLSIPETHNFIANDFIVHNCMGKKNPEEMAMQRQVFVGGAEKHGVKEQEASYIFDLMEKFAAYGFNKCLSSKTLIADSSGEIRSISEWHEQQNLNLVASIQPDFSMGRGKVVSIMENGIKPIFTLKTSLGKEITVTGNHPFLTIDGWKTLEELQIDERIASPAYLPVEGTEFWENFQLITLGWTLAEGNTCHPSGFYFYNNSYDAVQDFVGAVEQFDNTHPTIVQRVDRKGIYDVYVGTGCYGRIRVGERNIIQRSGARLWLESLNLIGFKATQKSFPPDVFRLNNQCLSVLIGRFWSGDGFIASSNNTTPYIATSSFQLVTQLQHLLLRLRIVSRVTEKHFSYKGGRIGYTLHLIGRRSVEQFVRLIVPHVVGKTEQIDFLNNHLAHTSECLESIDTVPGEIYSWICDAKAQLNISWEEMREKTGTVVRRVQHKLRGFRRTTVNKLAEFLNSQQLRQVAHPDIFWERVVSIEPAGVDMTYDLEIEDVHNFVANDIIVHNSHSAAYALVAYQTAWLKAHYPAAFMAAALSSDMDNTDKVVRLIDECRMMGLTIEPPHVNRSDYRFTVEKDKPLLVRYGLGAIKGAGENAIENIVEARHQKGDFQDLFDFCRRLDLKKVNRRVLEASLKAGALDKLAPSRAITLASFEKAIKLADQHSSAKATGQNDMFGLSAATTQVEKPMFATNVAEWTLIETLQFEKDVLGFYISGHPIKQYQGELEQITSLRLGSIKPTEYKAVVRIAGWVVDLRHNQSKRGKMASLTLEDMTGQFEVVVYPDIYSTVKDMLAKDTLLIAEGEIREDKFSGGRHMVANQLLTLEKIRETAKRLVLHITPEQANHETVLGLKAALEPYQAGKCPIYVMYQRPEAQIEIILGAAWKVNIQESMLNELRNLLTINNVRVIYS